MLRQNLLSSKSRTCLVLAKNDQKHHQNAVDVFFFVDKKAKLLIKEIAPVSNKPFCSLPLENMKNFWLLLMGLEKEI